MAKDPRLTEEHYPQSAFAPVPPQMYDSMNYQGTGNTQEGAYQEHLEMLEKLLNTQKEEIDKMSGDELKNHQLPLARVKKIMKSDEDVRMISAEAPALFAKACEMFIIELTHRSWLYTEENRRKTLQRSDIATAIAHTDIYDFLLDIVPKDIMEADTLRTALLSRYRELLAREFLYQAVSDSYERAICTPSFTTWADQHEPASTVKLNSKVEEALRKAKKVWNGRIGTNLETEIEGRNREKSRKFEFSPSGRLKISINHSVLGAFLYRKRAWRYECRKLRSQITDAEAETEISRKAFFSAIHKRRSAQPPTVLEALVVHKIAMFSLLRTTLAILRQPEVLKSMQAASKPRKEAYRYEDAVDAISAQATASGLEMLISEIRSQWNNDLQRYVDAVPSLDPSRAAVSVPWDFGSEYQLLTHLKHIESQGDLEKVIEVYRAGSRFVVAKAAITAAATLPESVSLSCLRVLHCIVNKNGSVLMTAVRSKDSILA